MKIDIHPRIQIDESEIEVTYARSSGPGGQNVNKVNSKAVLRWCLESSRCLVLEDYEYLKKRLAHRLNLRGEIVIMSDRFRDQGRNREDCFQKLKELLTAAMHRPKPRKKSKPSRSVARKNQASKIKHGQKKRLRRFRDE